VNSKCLILYSYNDKKIDHGNSPCKGLSIKLSFYRKELNRIIVVNSLGLPAVFLEGLSAVFFTRRLSGGLAGWLNGSLISDFLVNSKGLPAVRWAGLPRMPRR